MLLSGTILAIIIGIAGPLAYEVAFKRRMRCRDDVERDFGIPVLAEFDRIARFT